MRAILPRNIFTYWEQGFDDAPRIARTCLAQLRRLHPHWELRALDAASAEEAIEALPLSRDELLKLSRPHRSDLIRTQLLIDHGGVWADPTVFVTRPFDEWLDVLMGAGLFLFANPGRDRRTSNWFIAAEPGHDTLVQLRDRLCAYWANHDFRNQGRPLGASEKYLMRAVNRNLTLPRLWFTWPLRRLVRVYPYMVYHYMLQELVHESESVRRTFEQMPVFPAEGPCRLLRFGVGNAFGPEAQAILDDAAVPLHKLTWKFEPRDVVGISVLERLEQIARSLPAADVRSHAVAAKR